MSRRQTLDDRFARWWKANGYKEIYGVPSDPLYTIQCYAGMAFRQGYKRGRQQAKKR